MEAGLDHNLQPASKRPRACENQRSSITSLYNSSAVASAADMNPPAVAALPLPVPPPPPPPPPTCNNIINVCSFDQNYQQQHQQFPMITASTPAAPPPPTCSTDSVPAFDYVAILAGLPTEERDFGQPSAIPPGGKTKPCTKFFSTSGCPYGESCHFLHFVPGGIAALGLAVSKPMPTPSGTAHDPSLTVNGYKTRLCNRFNTPEGCRFGDNCHFAHGESDLRRPGKPTYAPQYALNQASTNPPPVQMQPAYNQTTMDPSSGYMMSTAVYATGADGSNYAATASAAGCYASCGYAPNPAYNQNPYATNGATNYAASYAAPPVTYQSYPAAVPAFTYTGPAQTVANTSTYTASNANANTNVSANDANAGITNIMNNPVSNSNYGSEPTPPGVTVSAPTVVMPASGYEGTAVLTA